MHPVTFDRAQCASEIGYASCVTELVPVIKKQLGIARFVVERLQIDDTDSYMDERCARDCVDGRARWLYYLTNCLQELALADGKSRLYAVIRVLSGAYLLSHFTCDIGSIAVVHPDNFGILSELKKSALATNAALFNVLRLLCKNKKSRYSWGFNPFKTREHEPDCIEEPVALSNDFYSIYYRAFVPAGECDPRNYLIAHYGIYDAVSLVPAPASFLGARS